MYHNPVLRDECIAHLVINPSGIYVDCTFGGGGHSRAILKTLSPDGKLISFDQDKDVLPNKLADERWELVLQNFRYLKNNLRLLGIKEVDGIIADLGVSSHQFDTAERGFSTRFEGDLDMRMNQDLDLDAKKILNEYSEEDLASIFYYYGELKGSRKMAKNIVDQRKERPFKTIEQLKELFHFIPKNKQNRFFAQLFQALRIEVNDELNALKEMLLQTSQVIKKNGRLVVLSYHSLEDRIVKRFLKTGLFEGEPEKDLYGNWEAPFKPLQNKIIIPNEKEIKENSRARSAKLRIGIKN